jgi:hypothetical protein
MRKVPVDFVDELPPDYVEPHSETGTVDDQDDLDDEREDENEVPVRETNEMTEAPEEFEKDDEDDLGHPEDDDLDE